jgi:hypothetical protein
LTTNSAILDAAVRAFLRDNPLRGYCTCFGCAATINANYRAIQEASALAAAPSGVSSPVEVWSRDEIESSTPPNGARDMGE